VAAQQIHHGLRRRGADFLAAHDGRRDRHVEGRLEAARGRDLDGLEHSLVRLLRVGRRHDARSAGERHQHGPEGR
jgi:hypothetical protein